MPYHSVVYQICLELGGQLVCSKKGVQSLNSFLAPMKFPPLSEWRSLGLFLLDTNRFKAAKNVPVVWSDAGSKWTALVVKHTNTAM